MTDFTKEFIVEARESITEPGVERYICIPVQLEMLDEIERLQSRIAELEAENEKINYFFRRLRMFCIFAHWDNPNTEAEFCKVDAEISEYLSEHKACIDQLTAHDATERQGRAGCAGY